MTVHCLWIVQSMLTHPLLQHERNIYMTAIIFTSLSLASDRIEAFLSWIKKLSLAPIIIKAISNRYIVLLALHVSISFARRSSIIFSAMHEVKWSFIRSSWAAAYDNSRGNNKTLFPVCFLHKILSQDSPRWLLLWLAMSILWNFHWKKFNLIFTIPQN